MEDKVIKDKKLVKVNKEVKENKDNTAIKDNADSKENKEKKENTASSAFIISEELKKLPDMPGVYIMHGDRDEIIYIGKAKVLRNRVKQYFQKSYKKSVKIQQMVRLIQRFEYIVVDTELEALILESNLIKEYRPRYNTLLKDDKNYPYIQVTLGEEYPRVRSTRKRMRDQSKYYGPYASKEQINEVIELILKTFHVRQCNKSFSKDHLLPRPCLYYDMKQCEGPCIGKQSPEEYRMRIGQVIDFLNGNYEDIVKELKRKMNLASDNMNYEDAIEYRDLIRSIEAVQNRQKITAYDQEDRDILGMCRDGNDCIVQIFFIRAGKIIGRDHQFINIDAEDSDDSILEAFIQQYYNGTPFIPREIWVQSALGEVDILGEWLSALKGRKVTIITPKIGQKEKLVELAKTNAGILMNRYRERYREEKNKTNRAVGELGRIIGMKNPPKRIESYDISNTSGALNVGSMVVYENGLPKPNAYRKFRIRSVQGPDDYASMKEMLLRRFKHGLKEREETAGRTVQSNTTADSDGSTGLDSYYNELGESGSFSDFPDLILMDGGKGQVNVCEEVLRDLDICSVTVCGMVKDDNHRTRALLYKDEELSIDTRGEVFRLITRIQDEVHRFAIEYHRSLRGKAQVKSILDDIVGIGIVRKRSLLRHFKDIDHIRKATLEELMACPHLDKHSAKTVFEFFKAN